MFWTEVITLLPRRVSVLVVSVDERTGSGDDQGCWVLAFVPALNRMRRIFVGTS